MTAKHAAVLNQIVDDMVMYLCTGNPITLKKQPSIPFTKEPPIPCRKEPRP
jgi:hypothetical protein